MAACSDVGDDRNGTVEEVIEILEMWRFLEEGDAALAAGGKAKVEREPGAKAVRFPGFDGNHEGEHMGVARFLVERMDYFPGFAGRGLQFALADAGSYRRMLAAFLPIRTDPGRPRDERARNRRGAGGGRFRGQLGQSRGQLLVTVPIHAAAVRAFAAAAAKPAGIAAGRSARLTALSWMPWLHIVTSGPVIPVPSIQRPTRGRGRAVLTLNSASPDRTIRQPRATPGVTQPLNRTGRGCAAAAEDQISETRTETAKMRAALFMTFLPPSREVAIMP